MGKKYRIFMLDVIRLVCALLIFMRHSITMFGCTYDRLFFGGADTLIQNLTSEVMTCFFVLSGLSLFYSYHKNDMKDTRVIIKFYKKSFLYNSNIRNSEKEG